MYFYSVAFSVFSAGISYPESDYQFALRLRTKQGRTFISIESTWQVHSYQSHTWVGVHRPVAIQQLELQVHMLMVLVQLVIVFRFMVMFVMVAMSEVIDPGLIRDATDPTHQTGFIVKNRWLDLDVLGGQVLLDQSKGKNGLTL